MTEAQLAARVATQATMSRTAVDAAVNAVFSATADAIAGGDTATIAGFGTITTRSRPARQGGNPRTGECIAIAASNRVANWIFPHGFSRSRLSPELRTFNLDA